MDCLTTRSIDRRRSGLTLVEMMVAIGLSSILGVALCSLTIYSARSFRALIDYTDLNQNSRMALDKISKEIRQSRGLVSFTTSTLVFRTDTNGLYNFSISYDQPGKRLLFIDSKGTNVLSKDCALFNYQLFNRNSQTVTNPAMCKMVQLNFNFSRNNLRTVTNSESIQSMKVVIRKKADQS